LVFSLAAIAAFGHVARPFGRPCSGIIGSAGYFTIAAAMAACGEGAMHTLVIGNKNTSSWSLRPWVAMRHAGIAFHEALINLRASDAKAQILRHSPSGKVPALLTDGRAVIWDSLAILEYLAETYPEAVLWPADRDARAMARSAAAEMHSGFQALRENCPMDFTARLPHRGVVAGLPTGLWRRRAIAVWDIHGGRRHVCTGRLPLSHVSAGPRPLRR
jgi:hypothetical protein